MKKIILFLIIVIGIGWFFRYSLDRIIISPFVKSSKEEALVDAFLQTCIPALGDAQKIESMAESSGWQPYRKDEWDKLKMTPSSIVLGGWVMPNDMSLLVSQEVFYGKPANVCIVPMQEARSFFALPAFLSKFDLGSPGWNVPTAANGYNLDSRVWLTTIQGKRVELTYTVVSGADNAAVWLGLTVPQ